VGTGKYRNGADSPDVAIGGADSPDRLTSLGHGALLYTAVRVRVRIRFSRYTAYVLVPTFSILVENTVITTYNLITLTV